MRIERGGDVRRLAFIRLARERRDLHACGRAICDPRQRVLWNVRHHPHLLHVRDHKQRVALGRDQLAHRDLPIDDLPIDRRPHDRLRIELTAARKLGDLVARHAQQFKSMPRRCRGCAGGCNCALGGLQFRRQREVNPSVPERIADDDSIGKTSE